MAELKPCPFCGGKPPLVEKELRAWVKCRCSNCEVLVETFVFRTAEEAIEAWNRRTEHEKPL